MTMGKGKFKYLAYITCCIGCKRSKTTLFKLVDKIVICKECKNTLITKCELTIHDGSKLKRIPGTNNLVHVPLEKKKEV